MMISLGEFESCEKIRSEPKKKRSRADDRFFGISRKEKKRKGREKKQLSTY